MRDHPGIGTMTPAAAGDRARVFIIHGAASAQLPLRLLNFFAQQDLLPDTVCLMRARGGIAMRIAEATLDVHRAGVILAKMRALPDVASATLDGDELAALDGTGRPSFPDDQVDPS